LLVALVIFLGAGPSWAQRAWRSRREVPPPPPTAATIDSSVLKSAAASTTPPDGIPSPQASGDGPPTVYYFDGRMHWCQLPDDTVLVWSGSKWVPPGVIYWGNNRNNDPARAAAPPGTWIHSRFNVESRDYRSRYGTDAWFRYGPGHFLD
jgi:hypothetical protein